MEKLNNKLQYVHIAAQHNCLIMGKILVSSRPSIMNEQLIIYKILVLTAFYNSEDLMSIKIKFSEL
jgi:hypothetical protein